MKNLKSFEEIDLAACADLDVDRAKAKAAEHGIEKGCSVEELLADEEIELVVNLTIPAAHAEVSIRALEAGKHVYSEKPLAAELEDGKRILAVAEARGLKVGCAPDTFLGAGIQTCRRLILDGAIGEPVAATAFMMARGHEVWHPSPEFYYQKGGGPMFDMGPYYLTALVALIGPIREIAGMTSISFPERTILSEPKKGTKIQVEVPTHIAGTMRFANGAVGTIITSFDIPGGSSLPHIEIYGSQGTLQVPNPNNFSGKVLLRPADSWEWQEVPVNLPYAENNRGLGVLDMARAIRSGSEYRASGDLAYHVLEAMHGFSISSDNGSVYRMSSSVEPPVIL
jgi:predicted dehydrogenase